MALLKADAFGVRGTFHVLTGFDTSYAVEIGVLAFTTAQGYPGVTAARRGALLGRNRTMSACAT